MAVTPQTNATLEEIAQSLAKYRSFAICGHINPDGDCIGSELALAHALKALGKDVACLFAKTGQSAASLDFLPGYEWLTAASQYDGTPDVFIGVDVPSRERIGEAVDVLDRAELSVTIDHHAYNPSMCDMVYVDPDAASTSLLIWEMLPYLVAEPSEEMAACAYTGLVSDTGGFAYQNTDARTFDAAASMVKAGACPELTAKHLFQNRSLAELKLEACSLGRMEFLADGQAVFSYITADDIRNSDASPEDFDSLIDTLRTLGTIRVACILREQEDCVRGSLRAKDDTDVAEIARSFGGGGHKAAAGFTLYVPIAQACEAVKRAIEEALSEGGE